MYVCVRPYASASGKSKDIVVWWYSGIRYECLIRVSTT